MLQYGDHLGEDWKPQTMNQNFDVDIIDPGTA